MSEWKVVYTNQAQKDAKKLTSAGLKKHARRLLETLQRNPYQTPPPHENLVGDLTGAYSCRIHIQHRLVYQMYERESVVKVIRLWSHYE